MMRSSTNCFTFSPADSDGDIITISSDEELVQALDQFEGSIFRLYLKKGKEIVVLIINSTKKNVKTVTIVARIWSYFQCPASKCSRGYAGRCCRESGPAH